MLDDITEYYLNETEEIPHNQYKRKPLPQILGECHLCGTLLDDECEIVVNGNYTFCSTEHMEEYKKLVENGEI